MIVIKQIFVIYNNDLSDFGYFMIKIQVIKSINFRFLEFRKISEIFVINVKKYILNENLRDVYGEKIGEI